MSIVTHPALFSFAGIRRGFFAAQPLATGVFIYGVAFGLLAREAKLSLLEALLMSGFVYSGSAQIAAVSGMTDGRIASGSAILAVIATILLLNARYLLYGAALRPWLGAVDGLRAYPTLAVLGDGNWILSMKAANDGESDAGFIFGSGIAMFLPWLGGTLLGSLAGSMISNPALLGVDFMLVAFSAAMAVGMVKGKSDGFVLMIAACTALVADRVLPAGWTIVLAGLAGAITAWIRFKPKAEEQTQ
jgi:4-azaleucine resistance transporter AzlC